MQDSQLDTSAMHVCPWWAAYSFDNWLRRLVDPAEKALGQWVRPGMKVMDFGCGLGHYSIGAARLVGENGRVVAVDLQPKMLEIAGKRAIRSGVSEIIDFYRCDADGLNYEGKVDFAVAGNVVHETPDPRRTLKAIYEVLVPGGGFFFTEPRYHVKVEFYEEELKMAADIGFEAELLPCSIMARRAYLVKR